MNNEDKHFIKRYEELLDKGYCDCNEMNCIDNNSPRRILNIVKDLQKQLEAYENMRKEAIEYIHNNKLFYIQEETIVPISTTAKIEIERHIYSKKRFIKHLKQSRW